MMRRKWLGLLHGRWQWWRHNLIDQLGQTWRDGQAGTMNNLTGVIGECHGTDLWQVPAQRKWRTARCQVDVTAALSVPSCPNIDEAVRDGRGCGMHARRWRIVRNYDRRMCGRRGCLGHCRAEPLLTNLLPRSDAKTAFLAATVEILLVRRGCRRRRVAGRGHLAADFL